ncbi:Ig-like domain-containing protein [uncultured Maribacter sp.]|uniref:Ig-like domain-containing protein n=1 Tax=uncultured Maribacter sp. TaxID=431308 RepID=UPI00260AE4E2|nr:Ig-like domain-containing protein [uncultured Maribacter sp.]
MLQRILTCFFFSIIIAAFYQCARRGNPTGGPKDLDPPVLIKAEPENMSVNFKNTKIRLYFDEYVKLKDVQEQLIVSPPLKYTPLLSPQGSASKYVEIKIKDTLKENTTYTFNFGESIVDNNEGNPNRFLTYVFSTGSYIDSLEITGVIKDAFNKDSEEFVSVMLYEIDSTYNDSTIFKSPPNYITNTLDSTIIFNLRNLKKGKYALFALKDEAKNNIFDQNTDKIGFIKDTVTVPTDSIFLLNLFKEVPNFSMSLPSLTAKNKITFGYYGDGNDIEIDAISKIPDSVIFTYKKEYKKDSINFWFTPFAMDSLLFLAKNNTFKTIDTFKIKNRKLALDSLKLSANYSGGIDFNQIFEIASNTPIIKTDTSKIKIINKDSLAIKHSITRDTLKNSVVFSFDKEPNESYQIDLLPGAITDFFNTSNDTLSYNLQTKSYADYGNLRLTLVGNNITFPIIIQLTNEKGEVQREIYATENKVFEFNNLNPSKYLARVLFDTNANKKWDTGNYLKQIQPERVSYYPVAIEVRANWELEQTFTILD